MTTIDERIRAVFDPILERIAASAVDRECDRQLPHAEVRELIAAGLGAIRVPTEFGGWGVSLEQEFRLLIRLGEADSNLPQLLRGHIAFVETQRGLPDTTTRSSWLTRIATDGILFGNAQAEKGEETAVGTRLEHRDGRLLLTGRKFYSTGSLFADWIWTGARLGDDPVALAVRTDADGVTLVDDWDGFGQRMTGSGTTVFDEVEIDPGHVLPWADNNASRPLAYTQGLYQLILLAALAGISGAVLRDVVDYVRQRTRTFGVPGASSPKDDELVQRVVGRIASIRSTVEATTLDAVRQLSAADDIPVADDSRERRFSEALVRVFEAQQTVIPLVLEAATLLFDVGGASAIAESRALDRHWRNARAISSHNPAIHRERMLGDYYLNGTPPESLISIARRAASTVPAG